MEVKHRRTGRERLSWHPAFHQAIQLELFDWRNELEFQTELQLTSEPLRIDLLVIKKPMQLVIDKNIARIFKNYNIIEYKSPDDYFSIKDFFKVYAYAYIYAAITPNVDLSEITITFIENRYPRNFLKYLTKTKGYRIEESTSGIYEIHGDYIPMQMIESKKLPESENLWLKSLTKDLEVKSVNAILEASGKCAGKAAMDAFFDILARANPDIFLEVQAMANSKKPRRTFEEVFTEAGLIPEWIERGRVKGMAEGEIKGKAEGKTEGKTEVARNLFSMGMPIEQISKAVQMPVEELSAEFHCTLAV